MPNPDAEVVSSSPTAETLNYPEIPTRQFRVAGYKGTFSIDAMPSKHITPCGLMDKYGAFWNCGKNHAFATGFNRRDALSGIVQLAAKYKKLKARAKAAEKAWLRSADIAEAAKREEERLTIASVEADDEVHAFEFEHLL